MKACGSCQQGWLLLAEVLSNAGRRGLERGIEFVRCIPSVARGFAAIETSAMRPASRWYLRSRPAGGLVPVGRL